MTDSLEVRLTKAAGSFRYPPTPDLIATQQPAPLVPRLAWIAIAVAIALVAVVSVPPVRAAVFEVLGIGSVQVSLGGPSVASDPERVPLSELPGQTDLCTARKASPVSIRLPAYPADLGAPDRVYLLEEVGGTVVLVWEQSGVESLARLALYVIPPGELVNKLEPETIAQTEVAGQPALWTTGDHFLELITGDPEKRVLVTGNVLIWTSDGVTYRLETDFPLEEALKVAESLR